MKNVIKKNSKLIIAFSLGFILSIGTVFAASKLYASKVSVDTTSMPALGSESNVEEALTYLYQRAADAGLTGTGNHSLVPTKYHNVYETYLDPTNLSKKCTAAEAVSTPGTKTGCMKWYVYAWSDTNYSMILDHNTHEEVTWADAKTNIESLSSSWDSRLAVRLISLGEVLRAAEYSETFVHDTTSNYRYINGLPYSTGYSTSSLQYGAIESGLPKGAHPQAWLIDYLSGCETYGCNVAGTGTSTKYWLLGSYASSDYQYYIDNRSLITYQGVGATSGVRPVITISKAVF